jgi:ATP-dependent protease ClpP protease subunit
MILENVIPLVVEEIRLEDVFGVVYAFQKTNSRSMLLNSGGGSIYSFVKLGSYIAERRIITVGSGSVDSLALNFFLCGETRVATPESTFFIHESFFHDNSGKKISKGEAQMKALICEHQGNLNGYRTWNDAWKNLSFFDLELADLISRKTFLSAGTVMELMRKGHMFDVDEAMRYGIIHDVVESRQIRILPQFGTYQPF